MSQFKRTVMGAIGSFVTEEARLCDFKHINESYSWMEFESPALQTKTFKPADKVQINVGNWDIRTYTPLTHDSTKGRMQILAFHRTIGPASLWIKNWKHGQNFEYLGPRGSIDVTTKPEQAIVFGDETSLAVAATIQRQQPDSKIILEVENQEHAKQALAHIGITNATLLQRSEDAEPILKAISAAAQSKTPRLILTGGAYRIQILRPLLKVQQPALFKRLTVKAYWAEGKVGID